MGRCLPELLLQVVDFPLQALVLRLDERHDLIALLDEGFGVGPARRIALELLFRKPAELARFMVEVAGGRLFAGNVGAGFFDCSAAADAMSLLLQTCNHVFVVHDAVVVAIGALEEDAAIFGDHDAVAGLRAGEVRGSRRRFFPGILAGRDERAFDGRVFLALGSSRHRG
jgi:hypothetical protein